MEVPLRTAYGQNGRCGMQPKAKHSLRAQAQLMRTETVETFELVKVEQKLLRQRKREREKGERESPAVYGHDTMFYDTVVKITWSVAKSPRVAEQCDVNFQSINKTPWKERGSMTKGVHLLADNALAHSFQDAVQDSSYVTEILSRPPYSPNLVPSDFF
ncbi:hypothetical protein TNCV_1824381 [Trichonephila clavipes]|nr:hypothetical protein TNCV_1824381 [Trichonephila clavipes]